jgi:hypothetical protein
LSRWILKLQHPVIKCLRNFIPKCHKQKKTPRRKGQTKRYLVWVQPTWPNFLRVFIHPVEKLLDSQNIVWSLSDVTAKFKMAGIKRELPLLSFRRYSQRNEKALCGWWGAISLL